MARGRQVADAYIEVHGDLKPFREDLNSANGSMEDWAKENADNFGKAWGKRMQSQMDHQWNSIIDAMHSGNHLDFNRMINAFDPSDHIKAFSEIDDMMQQLVKTGKLDNDQRKEMSARIAEQIEFNMELNEAEEKAQKDRREAYAENARFDAAQKKMWREAIAMNQAHNASRSKMLREAFAQNAAYDARQRKSMQDAIAMNEQWKKSFSGILNASKEMDLDRKFNDLGTAMATNDWSGLARGTKDMKELRERTMTAAREMQNLGRMTDEQFVAVQDRLKLVGRDMDTYNVRFTESNKQSDRHSKSWSLIQRMIGNAGKKFAGFTGLNVIGDVFRDGARFFQDLDRNAVKIGKMALMIGTLGSVVVNMLGGIAVVGQDLAKLAQIGVLGPAFLIGAGIQAGVLMAALKDMGTVLKDLKPAFQDLQNTISSNFWDVAAQPIRDMVTTLLPTLQTKLNETAAVWGGMFADMANSLAGLDQAGIGTMFDRMNAGIEIARGAVDPLIQAFYTMGMVGSEYFERFGTWIRDLSTRFNNFIQGAAADGRLNLWIEEAIQAFKDVWSILGSGISIFNAIGNAAEAAGIGGLGVLAANMEKVAAVMNGSGFQTVLTQLFAGAHQAASNVGQAILGLGPAITSIMPTITNAMISISESVSLLIGYFGELMSNPVLQKGITDFVTGIQSGITKLGPAITPMGDSLGQIGTLLGQVAGIVGGLVTALVTNLSPVLDQVTAAFGRISFAAGPEIEKIIGSIGEVLRGFVDMALPPLEKIVMTVLPLLAPAFEALIPVVEAVQGALKPFLDGIAELVEIIAPVLVPAIQRIAEALTPVIEVIGKVVGAIMDVLVPVLGWLITTIIGNVVGVFEGLSNIIMGVVDIITAVFTGFGEFFTKLFEGDISGALTALGVMFAEVWHGTVKLLSGVWDVIWNGVQLLLFGKIFGGIKAALTGIGGFFKTIWDDIPRLISKAWDNILGFVTTGLTKVWSVTSSILSKIGGFFKTIWDDTIRVVSGAFTKIVQGVSSGIGKAKQWVSDGLSAIGNFFRTKWDDAARAVSGAWTNITGRISSGLSTAQRWVSDGLGAIGRFFTNGWNNAVQATSRGINNVINWVRNIPGNISNALGNLGNLLHGAGSSIISGFLQGLKNRFQDVKNFVGGIADWIRNNKGPISYDKVLLIPAGNAIMDGLGKGLEDKIGMLKGVLDTVTGTMTDTVTDAFAKNKMYLAGADAALGLADGLKSNKSAVVGALSAIMPAASTSVSASLVSTRTEAGGGRSNAPSAAAGAGLVIEAGAIVVSTPTKSPELVAAKVIDQFANYSNL